jgi:cell division protein FtsL
MATLATWVNRFAGVRELAGVAPAVWTRTESPRLRPIANEDVYLFVKRIDNTAVARAADPAARTARSRSMATGFVAALLVIAGLVPMAYNTTAGFTLEHLRSEQAQLKQEMAKLQATEAKLVSVERLEQLAKTLKMSEPAPQQVETLQGPASKAEAKTTIPVMPAVVVSR